MVLEEILKFFFITSLWKLLKAQGQGQFVPLGLEWVDLCRRAESFCSVVRALVFYRVD